MEQELETKPGSSTVVGGDEAIGSAGRTKTRLMNRPLKSEYPSLKIA